MGGGGLGGLGGDRFGGLGGGRLGGLGDGELGGLMVCTEKKKSGSQCKLGLSW